MRPHIPLDIPRTALVALVALVAALAVPSSAAAQRLAAGKGTDPVLPKAPRAGERLLVVDGSARNSLVAMLAELSIALEDSPKRGGAAERALWGADTLGAVCVQFRDAATRQYLAPDGSMLDAVALRSRRRPLAMTDCPPAPVRVVMPRGVPATDSAFYVSEVARVPVAQQVTVLRWTSTASNAELDALAWYEGRGRYMRCTVVSPTPRDDWRGACRLVNYVRE